MTCIDLISHPLRNGCIYIAEYEDEDGSYAVRFPSKDAMERHIAIIANANGLEPIAVWEVATSKME